MTCNKSLSHIQGTGKDEDLEPTLLEKCLKPMTTLNRAKRTGLMISASTNAARRAGICNLDELLKKLAERRDGYEADGKKSSGSRVHVLTHFPNLGTLMMMKQRRTDSCHDLVDCGVPLRRWNVPALLQDAPASSHRGASLLDHMPGTCIPVVAAALLNIQLS